ncbi:hypothetical protein SPBR_01251 [Sporothrix brasiliensis 5110]|uniref:Uncharacterized protein n=1 Tax=Sporothrix brasiliensis 5110 TaxID=1398154 RepID=A0A0C2EWV5_9PEZI|nr:uncharacterized protein SPBR_01251 [Sporothrix brasiliensis 5110]KIH91054.1 hypothetical protein SPBR_01251 [Sporothrix brasiliensis 5110]
MRRTNTTTQHHPPRTPSRLSIATTAKSTTTATAKTPATRTATKTPAAFRPLHTNASPRVPLPPPARPRRPASTIGIDAKRASSTVSAVSSASSAASSSVASTATASPHTRASSRLANCPSNRPPATSATPRLALRARDRNAALSQGPATPRFLKPPLPSPAPRSTLSTLSALSSFSSASTPSSSPSVAMGYDKDTPRKPTLASRPFTRAPLTPKIAASSTSSSTRTPTLSSNSSNTPNAHSASSPYQTVTVSTPLARRVTGLSSASSNSSHFYSGNNDASSPSHLNNVTPRSGARQSRVDGGSTTPNGTPNGHGYGLGIGVGGAGHNASSAADPDSKFFYASDAKSSVSAAPSASASASHSTPSLAANASARPASTFFYANGKSLPPTNAHPPSSTSASTSALPAHVPPPMASPALSTPGVSASKFIHANGDALERKLSSSSSTRRAPATPATAQPTSTAAAPGATGASARPMSPVKMAAASPYPLQKSLSFPVVAPTSSASSSVDGSTNNTSNANINANANHRPSVPGNLSLNGTATTAGTAPLVASPGPVSPGSARLDVLSRPRSNFSASIGSIGSDNSAGGHSRNGSLTMADPPTVARLLHSSQPSSEAPSPASGQFPAYPFPSVLGPGGTSSPNVAASSGLAAILQAADDLAEDGADGSEADHHDGTTGDEEHGELGDSNTGKDSRRSSTNVSASGGSGAGGHTHRQVDELVLTARRERKVQDLEITNASLEAINRSLERQLRKQKNELRQFRRLSRSGRLSLAPSTGPMGMGAGGGSRVTSSSTVEGPMQDMDQLLEDDSFLDEFDEEYGSDMDASLNEDDENDDNEDDASSSSYSGGDTRRRRDERRLQLDMAQHRQLLVDSQKINQSIKRCMNWTEALIQEGQKALTFQVRVSEVQLGGRVLAADEVEERDNSSAHLDPSAHSERLLKESERLLEDGHDAHDGHDDHDDHGDVLNELDNEHFNDERSTSVAGTKADAATTADNTGAVVSDPVDTTQKTTTNTPAISSASAGSPSTADTEPTSRDEAFSPISHNVRTVRFDTDSGVDEAKNEPKPEAPIGIDSSLLDGGASAPAVPLSEASQADAVPSTPSKQPPAAAAVDNTAPVLTSPRPAAALIQGDAASLEVPSTPTPTPPAAVTAIAT